MKWKQDYTVLLVLMLLTQEFKADYGCRFGTGISYRGFEQVTRHQIPCQKWTDSIPHAHNFSAVTHPRSGLEENFCRNPDNDESGPWCYTISPLIRWDYCNIPMCDCEIWETQNENGICICKPVEECGKGGPSVCDNQGNMYKTLCAFSASICHGIIPLNSTLGTCGNCSRTKLTRGPGGVGEHPKYGLVSFRATERTQSGRVVYETLYNYNRKLVLKYDDELNGWIIAEEMIDGDHLAAFTLSAELWAQDGQTGWWILQKDEQGRETWKYDSSIYLECFEENMGAPQPRFFWVVFIALAASFATTTTAVVLNEVQRQRGCLWYPCVCTLLQEVKKLSNEVKAEKENIETHFGDPLVIKAVLLEIFGNSGILRSLIRRIKDLTTEFSTERNFLKSLTSVPLDLDENIQHVLDIEQNFVQYLSGVQTSQHISLMFTPVQLATGYLATMTASASVLSAVGSVISVAFSIVNIVHSIKEEEKQRDDLQEAKSKLIQHQARLSEAQNQINLIQKLVCQTDITYVTNIVKSLVESVENNMKYELQTWKNDLLSLFYRGAACQHKAINLKSLNHLKSIQTKMISFLEEKTNELKQAIQFIANQRRFYQKFTEDLKKYAVPTLKSIHGLKTLKDTLVMVAKLLPEESCYCGYDIGNIRKGNYDSPLINIPISKSLIHLVQTCTLLKIPLNEVHNVAYATYNISIQQHVSAYLVAIANPELQNYDNVKLPDFPCKFSLLLDEQNWCT